jgi:uncharacterized membrane protein YeaQ/YmgE (transglycosylase-associated protein family)
LPAFSHELALCDAFVKESGLAKRAAGTVEPMGLIAFLILGLIAGAIARFVVPGRDPMGWLATMVLGVVGAFVGGFLFGGPDDTVGLIGAVIGAVLVLVVYKLATGGRSRTA